MEQLFKIGKDLILALNGTDRETIEFICFCVLILGCLQYVLFKISPQYGFYGVLILHTLLWWTLYKCSVYNFEVHLLLYILPSCLISFLCFSWLPWKHKHKIILTEDYFEYQTNHGKIQIINPYRGICILGGAGSGKTLSLIKPTIQQLAQKKFAGIIYDYKKFDLSRCAYTHYKKSGIHFRCVNFFNLEYTNRINPLLPEFLENPSYANEAASVLFANLNHEIASSASDSFFYKAAESALSGIIWRLKEDFPQECNLPTAISISLHSDYRRIASFIARNRQASLNGSTYLQSVESPKQAIAIIATVSSALRSLVIPEIFYVLSGNDFSLDLNHKNCPTILCISNDQKLDKSYSPIIALLINMAIKQMNNEGKQQSVLLLDEAATLRIPGMDNVPATSRENKIVSIVCFQDMTQGEELYGRIGRDKLIANLANQFYGRVVDPTTAERYSKMFGKRDRPYTSKTRKSWNWTNSSYTTTLRDIEVYKPQLFLHLQPGEFYGILAEGVLQQFNGIFTKYKTTNESLPLVKTFTKYEIQDHFNRIVTRAGQLIGM